MIPQVGKEAVSALGRELSRMRSGQFSTYVINRLKNENPRYIAILERYINVFRENFGEEAYTMIRDVIATSYRLIELSEKYPDKEFLLSQVLSVDPSIEGTTDAIMHAKKETNELIRRLTLHRE